jgi:hypothetical protein
MQISFLGLQGFETLLPMICPWISVGKLMDEWTVDRWMKGWKERRMF